MPEPDPETTAGRLKIAERRVSQWRCYAFLAATGEIEFASLPAMLAFGMWGWPTEVELEELKDQTKKAIEKYEQRTMGGAMTAPVRKIQL